MNQHQLSSGPLLDANGNLAEAGYAFSLCKNYDRSAIKAKKSRIKEWDYYYIGNSDHGLALTVADNGYMSLVSASLLSFGESPREITKTQMGLFPFGKLNLPFSSSSGDIVYEKGGVSMCFLHKEGKRHLTCFYPGFGGPGIDFHCDLTLAETTGGNSMVIATPFKKPHHFYYNQKINNQSAIGYAKLGDEFIDFSKNSYAVLDWGRGVWTYGNTWYWSSLNSYSGGRQIGFNLGYGFGDTSAASENMLFVDKAAYKLGEVRMDIPVAKNGKDDFMKPWKFRSDTGEIDLVFTPVINRHAATNLIFLKSIQNQVFGYFSGRILIEGVPFEIVRLFGFAEKVTNRW